jgi:hypothetical protein
VAPQMGPDLMRSGHTSTLIDHLGFVVVVGGLMKASMRRDGGGVRLVGVRCRTHATPALCVNDCLFTPTTHTNTPTHQHTNTPTHQHTNTPTHQSRKKQKPSVELAYNVTGRIAGGGGGRGGGNKCKSLLTNPVGRMAFWFRHLNFIPHPILLSTYSRTLKP